MDFKTRYQELKIKLKQKGYSVLEVDKDRLHDYAGMNPEAAKDFGYDCKDKCFEIDRNMSYEDKYETLVHEVNEYGKMKKGKSYWKAHVESLDDERTVSEIL